MNLDKIKQNKCYQIISNFIKTVIVNDFYGMAAEMGFWLVIGIFPFMLFLMAVFGWMGNKSYMDSILLVMANIMPEQAINLILTVLSEVMIFSKPGIMAAVGLCITLVLSTNAMACVLKGLNRAYKVEERRNFVYTRLLSFVMVIINALVLFLSINLIVFGKILIHFAQHYLNMPDNIASLLLMLRWPVAFLALYIMAFLCYYLLPDLRGNDTHKRASALPGTLFFCIFWLAGSWGFSIYVNNLGTYNLVYGTIGAFAVLMVWLYYTSVLLLVGGEINSQVYNKLEQKANEIKNDFANLKHFKN